MTATPLTLLGKLLAAPSGRRNRGWRGAGLRRPDLPAPTIAPAVGVPIPFYIHPAHKHRLLHGLDDIALTLARTDRIRAFEARRRAAEPWLFN